MEAKQRGGTLSQISQLVMGEAVLFACLTTGTDGRLRKSV